MVDKTFDLLCELEAEDWQLDFPIVYGSGLLGHSSLNQDSLEESLEPLFDTILKHVPPPRVALERPLQLQVSNVDYDEYKGRVAIGRVVSGKIVKGMSVDVCSDRRDEVKTG